MKRTVNFKVQFTPIEKINPLVTRCSCDICTPDEQGNGYEFSEDVLTKMIPTVMAAPVVTYYSAQDDQFMGHEDDYVMLKNSGYRQTPPPQPVGIVDYTVKPEFKEIQNKNWLCCDVLLWTGRFPYLDGLSDRKDVHQSMEVGLDYKEQNGVKVVTDAICVGLCIIGIEPAFEGSGFMTKSITQFSEDTFKNEVDNLKKEYKEFVNKYSTLDFTIPQEVKDNAKNGLDMYKKYNRGGTAVDLAFARYTVKNKSMTPKRIKKMTNCFSKHDFNNIKNSKQPNDDFILLSLYGGKEGYSFSSNLQNSMDEIDKKYKNAFMSQEKEENMQKHFSVGDKLGTASNIDIDNTTASAIKSGSWSGQDANFLNKLLEAGNHKALIEEAYASVDGDASQDLSVNDVGYPHHEIQGDKLILSVPGVEAAYKRARQQGVTGKIMQHIQRHRKSLGLEDDKMNKKEIKSKLSEELAKEKCAKDDKEMCKYALISYDDNNVFALDNECGKMSIIPYSVAEDKLSLDYSKAKKGKLACNPDDADDGDDDAYMSAFKSIFSSDENVDNKASEKRSDAEAKENKKVADSKPDDNKGVDGDDKDTSANMAKELKKTKQDMDDMAKKNEKLAKENKELKASVDKYSKAEKMSKVESVLSDVIDDIPKEKVEEFRKNAEKFSLDNLNGWANDVKAFAYSVVKKEHKDENITRMASADLYGSNNDKDADDGLWG